MRQANSFCDQYVGVLLAAGRGTRFDLSARFNKLQQPLSNGRSVAITAAENLLATMPEVVAVVRAGADSLATELALIGCKILVIEESADGMATSLVKGLTHTRNAAGWVIALADMPLIKPATIHLLVAALQNGAHIAVPTFQGSRGNPVAFAATHLPELLGLHGDEGARRLLKKFFVTEIIVDDPGVLQDVDTQSDLQSINSLPVA